jgi:pimeloyl-ACP methyl ester carboxylesterase
VVAAGAALRRHVPLRGGGPAWLRSFARRAPDGPGPTALADDALALLDHLDIARAGIVSQSMGGWAAAGAVVRAPARFAAVVLANTYGNLVDDEVDALRDTLRAGRGERPATPLARAAVGPTFHAANPAGAYLYAQISSLNPPRDARFGERLQANRTAVRAYAAAGVPTLFVTSDEDGLIAPELVACVAAKVPSARLLRVGGAGHSVYFEQPALFNREVGAFLAACGHA